MPYKDPERKRQWEREHREERNARRRRARLGIGSGQPEILGPAPDPASDQKRWSTWKTLIGLAVGIGVVLLGAVAGTSGPDTCGNRRNFSQR